MAEAFLRLSAADRGEVLRVAADRSGRPAHLLEKDVWVVWALATLFGASLGERLVPEGGVALALGDDYARMLEDGLLLDDAEPFTALMERCADIMARATAAARTPNHPR